MTSSTDGTTREERLAMKLRENLRRRKAQSREIAARAGDTEKPLPDNAGLPKDGDRG
ncbi:MAG: hypothetical protein ACK4ZA_06515 [Tsuneonella troitsensis]|jgi:hypothetical protein